MSDRSIPTTDLKLRGSDVQLRTSTIQASPVPGVTEERRGRGHASRFGCEVPMPVTKNGCNLSDLRLIMMDMVVPLPMPRCGIMVLLIVAGYR